MHRLSIAVLMVSAAGCAATDSPRNTAAASRARPINLPQQIAGLPVPTAIYHCDGDQHDSNKRYDKCSKGIPVVVLDGGLDQNNNPICWSLLPYNELKIHTGGKRTKVTWELVAPANYEFSTKDDKGRQVPSIQLSRMQNPTDPTQPDAVYDRPGMEGGTRRYKHEVMPGAPALKQFDHGAWVSGPNGIICKPLDPIIINADS